MHTVNIRYIFSPVFIQDTVAVGDPDRKPRPPPSRFRKYVKSSPPTKEILQQKQIEADKRRKLQEEHMIERVRETRDECIKINKKVEKLLQQDAKRHGIPGTETVKAMSRTEAKQAIRSVAEDFKNISKKITSTGTGSLFSQDRNGLATVDKTTIT